VSDARGTDKLSQLELDVQAARSELAATVGEITAWFDPKTRLTAAVDRGRQIFNDATDPAADPTDRTRARVVLGVAAGAVAALVVGAFGRVTRR
jgi:hypothetical protein